MNDDYITAQEAAAILRVCEDTIWKMCQDGELRAKKVRRQWRILATEVRSTPPQHNATESVTRNTPPTA